VGKRSETAATDPTSSFFFFPLLLRGRLSPESDPQRAGMPLPLVIVTLGLQEKKGGRS
jgi:hypothetical protein